MGAAQTNSRDVGEATFMVGSALKKDGEVTLTADEHPWGRQRMGMWAKFTAPMQLEKPIQQKPVITSCGLMKPMKQLARMFWMTTNTAQMASLGVYLPTLNLVGDEVETSGGGQFPDGFSRVRSGYILMSWHLMWEAT